jgi:hypothetical protein
MGRRQCALPGRRRRPLTDDIVERRLEPVAHLDRFSRSALLNPNFMLFARTHRLALASIMLPYKQLRCRQVSR